MKTVLCYGDSLTWGYSADGPARHAYEDRWPSVLAAALGPGINVIRLPEQLDEMLVLRTPHVSQQLVELCLVDRRRACAWPAGRGRRARPAAGRGSRR